MAKTKKGNRITYISCEEVFEDRPLAKQALEDSGEFSYGENDLSLVSRDKLIDVLNKLDIDEDDEDDTLSEIAECVEYLQELPATMYIDLETM